MSTTVHETYGRRLSAKTAELVYFIKGTEDSAAARDAMLTAAPTSHEGLYRDAAVSDVDEVPGFPGGAYTGRVQYKSLDLGGGGVRIEVNQTEFRFSTSGGTTNRKVSLQTVSGYSIYGAGQEPDFKGMIGVDENGIPQGVDVPVGGFDFEITKVYSMSAMNSSKINAIRAASNKVNSDNVTMSLTYPSVSLSFAAGELLFRGAQGGPRGSDEYQLTFAFSYQENLTGVSIGDMGGIDKDGWDALWTHHKPYVNDNQMALQPTSAYVERVIERVSMAGLI